MNYSSRTTKSMKNIIFGLIFKIVGMIFPFIIRTVMIQKLGVEYLGLNSLFTSILMVLSLSELGIGSALVFNMYKPIANNDTERVCVLLKVYKEVYTFIGLVILVIGLILMPLLPNLISGNCPSDINIYVLYLIYLVNTVVSYFMFAYKKSILEANQLNGYNSILETITTFSMYVLQIIALILFRNYYVYIIFLPVSTVALNIIRSYFVDKNFPEYRCRGKIEKGFIKELYKKVKALLGHKLGSTILTAADSIVISAILGLEILAIYSNYYQIINAVIGVVTIVYTSITASVGNSLIKSSEEQIYNNFNVLTFANNWIVGWFSVCLLCLFQPFMKIWMGKDLMFEMNVVILFVIYFYSWLFRRIGLTYKDAAGMWEQDFWKPYVGIAVNIIANIILCKIIGVPGTLISTIVIMLFIYFPWETNVIFKQIFKKSQKEYYLRMFLYLFCTVIVGLFTFKICTLISIEGIVGLILKGIICIVIPNILYVLFYFRTYEFNDVKKRVIDLVNGRKAI